MDDQIINSNISKELHSFEKTAANNSQLIERVVLRTEEMKEMASTITVSKWIEITFQRENRLNIRSMANGD